MDVEKRRPSFIFQDLTSDKDEKTAVTDLADVQCSVLSW